MIQKNFSIIPILGRIKNYPWGSYTTLATHRGERQSDSPEAELWFGDNPQGPSQIVGSQETLDGVTKAFGRLPFLAKILAVEHSLSLQVHPALTDIPALVHVLKDSNHKPEMVVALTQFEALVGFESVDSILNLVQKLDSPKVERLVAEPLRSGANLIEILERILGVPDESGILAEVKERVQNLDSARKKWLLELVELYAPHLDPLALLLCKFVTLEPGESLYLPPRCVHAYLNGTVVEVMANSDNVIRGGLTHKPIDKVNFLALVDTHENLAKQIAPTVRASYIEWQPPIDDFALRRYEGEIAEQLILGTFAIAFTWQGEVTFSSRSVDSERVIVARNVGVLLAPGEYQAKGTGSLWVVTGKAR